MLSRYHLIVFCAVTWLVIAPLSQADQSLGCDPQTQDCVAIGKWDFSVSLGYLSASNPTVHNVDLIKNVMPGVSYFGERFFWLNDVIGFTLSASERHSINTIATLTYDHNYFTDWAVSNFYFGLDQNDTSGLTIDVAVAGESEGEVDVLTLDLDRLHNRNMAVIAGLEYVYHLSDIELSVQLLHDASSGYDGTHIRSSAAKTFFWDKHSLAFDVGLEWQNARAANYFYGIRADEVDDPRLAYSVGDDFLYSVKIDWRRKISQHWELRAVWHNRWFSDNTYHSPLVKNKSAATVFVGGVYHF